MTNIHISLIITGILILVAIGILILLKSANKRIPSDIDLMEGHDFEYYCAELLKKEVFSRWK